MDTYHASSPHFTRAARFYFSPHQIGCFSWYFCSKFQYCRLRFLCLLRADAPYVHVITNLIFIPVVWACVCNKMYWFTRLCRDQAYFQACYMRVYLFGDNVLLYQPMSWLSLFLNLLYECVFVIWCAGLRACVTGNLIFKSVTWVCLQINALIYKPVLYYIWRARSKQRIH